MPRRRARARRRVGGEAAGAGGGAGEGGQGPAASEFAALALRRGRLPPAGALPPGRKETRIQRFARMILDFIGGQVVLESEIRRVFGNSPDTSKALRLLNAEAMVERTGRGGRADPFSYRQLP